jgi:hypothetical protein
MTTAYLDFDIPGPFMDQISDQLVHLVQNPLLSLDALMEAPNARGVHVTTKIATTSSSSIRLNLSNQ